VRTYIIKRLLLIPPTLLGITIISFAIMKLAPGSPESMMIQQQGEGSMDSGVLSAKAAEIWRAERHLDKPVHIQYVLWVRDLVTLNLKTFKPPREKVINRIKERLPITIILNTIAILLIYTVAIPIGIICAVKQNTLLDRGLTLGVFVLYSLPSFWVATILLIFLCDTKCLNWFPATAVPGIGRDAGLWIWLKIWTWHLVLPVICMTYGGFAFLSRQMRGSLLEQIRQDYVRTARAKGLKERVVILKHALRNSLIPIITLFGTLLPAMIAGSVIIESIFSIPGMGKLFLDSVFEREYPLLMTNITLIAILTMMGILISDLLYAIVNPTVSLEKST